MVYVFGPTLPLAIRKDFNLRTDDKKDPQNYIEYKIVKELVQKYNSDHVECDAIYLHEICEPVLMYSDYIALTKQWEEDQRPEHEKEEHRQRMIRSEDRKYQSSSKYFQFSQMKQGGGMLGPDPIKDYEKSLSFAMSFIFSIFASALVGYYIGVYFLSLSHDKSLILAVFFLIGGLMLETSLYIIKITKDQQITRLRQTMKSPPGNKTPIQKVQPTEQKQAQDKMKKEKID